MSNKLCYGNGLDRKRLFDSMRQLRLDLIRKRRPIGFCLRRDSRCGASACGENSSTMPQDPGGYEGGLQVKGEDTNLEDQKASRSSSGDKGKKKKRKREKA